MNRKATAIWKGTGKAGGGTLTTQSGTLTGTPYALNDRFGDGPHTNPEELIAAAHAGCFAMALAVRLEGAGITPDELKAEAALSFDKLDDGWTITRSHLVLTAKIPGLSDADFQKHAEVAKATCPISRVLKAEITLRATLVS